MRISDWSSDVCSSDLADALFGKARIDGIALDPDPSSTQTLGGRSGRPGAEEWVEDDVSGSCRSQDDAIQESFRLLGRMRFPTVQLQALEIGRASCRERVCQYV